MKFIAAVSILTTSYMLFACGGGGGSGSNQPGAEAQSPSQSSTSPTPSTPSTSSTPSTVSGGSPSAPALLSLSAKNEISNNSFNNYFKYAAVAGERIVIRVNLTIPLSDTQFARCSSNPGTGTAPSSYASQIHIYNSNNLRVGGICGENLTYTFPGTGTYVFNFEFPQNGSGFFEAAALKGDDPVKFLEVGPGTPTEPKKLNTAAVNSTGSDVFFNYYWISAIKGETIVANVALNQPLSDVQKTRCAGTPNSNNSQIYVFGSKLNQVGMACGESIRFAVPESGNYIFQFNYGNQSSGTVNAAKI